MGATHTAAPQSLQIEFQENAAEDRQSSEEGKGQPWVSKVVILAFGDIRGDIIRRSPDFFKLF